MLNIYPPHEKHAMKKKWI